MGSNLINLGAAFWGFAEATLFFIVPDVYLTAVGLSNFRKSIFTCLYALLGAMVGGVVMYYWGIHDVTTALGVLDSIPAISPDMLARTQTDLVDIGIWAILRGPLLGIPYKIFAVQSPSAGVGLMAFLLISIPARLIRFFVLTIAVPFLVQRLYTSKSLHRQMILLLAGWALFYLVYFLVRPN